VDQASSPKPPPAATRPHCRSRPNTALDQGDVPPGYTASDCPLWMTFVAEGARRYCDLLLVLLVLR
jgi:hypothetical protein